MDNKQRKRLNKILVAATLFIFAKVLENIFKQEYLSIAVLIVAYIIVGKDTLKKAFKNIKKKDIFDENFLMSIATLGAFAIGEYPEAVAVMLFYEVGELFQSIAVGKSRKSISDLMDIRPDYANLKKEDGSLEITDPYEIEVGDVIVVKTGEKIPLDGEVISGSALIDTSALTGESVPINVSAGDKVLSGSINTNSVLTIKVEKEFLDSTASKIIELVENASAKKSKTESLITRFARIYTPFVVISALIIAVVPPLILPSHPFGTWIYRALTFLVVSCPCALVISVPLSFFGGIGASSKLGVLVKGANYLEALSDVETVVFDKTGTLTKGVFEVNKINTKDISKEELLFVVAHAENYSSHPVAVSIKKAYALYNNNAGIDESIIKNLEEISGHGISAEISGKSVLVGNTKLMDMHNIKYEKISEQGTHIYVAIDGEYKGSIIISDKVKEDSELAIKALKEVGVKNTVMLTGDNADTANYLANMLGIDEVYAGLLPSGKLEKLEEMIAKKSKNKNIIFVGDGINDAPVLARADVGVAMGGLGSDAAIEAADAVIMTDEPSKLSLAIKLARRTLSIANQNIYFAVGVKFIVLILSVFGLANMWMAVFADVGVTIIAILNSIRNLNIKNIR